MANSFCSFFSLSTKTDQNVPIGPVWFFFIILYSDFTTFKHYSPETKMLRNIKMTYRENECQRTVDFKCLKTSTLYFTRCKNRCNRMVTLNGFRPRFDWSLTTSSDSSLLFSHFALGSAHSVVTPAVGQNNPIRNISPPLSWSTTFLLMQDEKWYPVFFS